MRPLSNYRHALRDEFGDRHYKIRHDGTIEVYGTMPNTSQDGWYLYGDVGNPDTEYRLFGDRR